MTSCESAYGVREVRRPRGERGPRCEGMLEELVAGAAEGLVLLQDSVGCEGRTLLKTFVAASARWAESIHVLSFDVPESEFKAGLSDEVTSRISFHDAFQDPLGWSGSGGSLTLGEFSASELAARLAPFVPGPAVLVLDSLSWLLLRLPFPAVCQVLAQLPRRVKALGLRTVQLVALLHGDLHPAAQLEILQDLARLVVVLEPALGRVQGEEGHSQVVAVSHRKRGSRFVQKKESFTVLPGYVLKCHGELPPLRGTSREEDPDLSQGPAGTDPAANLTFNLRLSEAERLAKESVPLPYHFSEEKKSSLLQAPTEEAKIYYEPDLADDIDEEDPDDDLDV